MIFINNSLYIFINSSLLSSLVFIISAFKLAFFKNPKGNTHTFRNSNFPNFHGSCVPPPHISKKTHELNDPLASLPGKQRTVFKSSFRTLNGSQVYKYILVYNVQKVLKIFPTPYFQCLKCFSPPHFFWKRNIDLFGTLMRTI